MSSGGGEAPKITVREVLAKKHRGERLVMVSAYDALFARLSEEGGADMILVGDSLANVILGLESTVPVTVDQMIYHGAAVRRGATRALVVVDMPFMSYQVSTEDALRNAGRIMKETNAQAVKVEGGDEGIAATVAAMTRAGIPVMGHIGFTPQSVNTLGGFRVQGRAPGDQERLVDEAKRLEAAGAFSVVLELVPAGVAKAVTEAVDIPTVGIGAGADCDGQVLVLHDLLGLNDRFRPKFLRRYAEMAGDVRGAVKRFGDDVRAGSYPDTEHSF
ncbi:MAG TPA: 3-methyl-2-oxobutanoate hydroxymethyltransferase [Gemmatimonadaceae bacterium]|nr:3-methyl-2-oxobutanoate hydroxymethyltransferase [Gemmatimonadaceae bacterium]